MSNLPSAGSTSFYDTLARDQNASYVGNATDEPYELLHQKELSS